MPEFPACPVVLQSFPGFFPSCRGKRDDSPPSSESHDPRRYPRRKTSSNRLLMFGRNRELALYRAAVLRDHGFDVAIPETLEEAMAAIRHGNYDIAILSYTLPNQIVQELAQLIREHCPRCPLIVISSTRRLDREIRPDTMVIANHGPEALLNALHRVRRTQ